MKKTNKKGFTLVELLVVIAILAILATVSVVGYTAFIERATVSNDENVAAQLNQFLTAMKADSTGKYYNQDVTPDNVWGIINAALEDNGTLDTLEPQSLDYGYHYFYKFDKDANDNYKNGEIVVAKTDDIIKNASKGFLARVNAAGVTNYGFGGVGFFMYDGTLYFILDTQGSDIATAVRGWYTTVDWNEFTESLSGDGFNYTEQANSTIFVTSGGNKTIGDTTKTNAVVHEDATSITKDGEDFSNVTTINIPDSAQAIENEVLNELGKNTESGTTATTSKTAEELSEILPERNDDRDNSSKDITVTDGNGNSATISVNDKGENTVTTSENTYTGSFSNPMASFSGILKGDSTKISGSYVAWEANTFTIEATNIKGKDENLPVTAHGVKWSSTNATVTVNENGTVTIAKNPSEEGFTSSVVIRGESETDSTVYTEFTVNFVYLTNATYTVDGKDILTNTDIDLLYSKSEEKGSYSLVQDFRTNIGVPEGMVLNTTATIVNADSKFELNSGVLTLKDASSYGSETLSVKPGVYDYLQKSVNITLYNADNLVFHEDNANIKFVGNTGTNITAGDLFKLNLADKDIPNDAQIWLVTTLGDTRFSLKSNVSPASEIATATKIDLDDDDWKSTEITFNANGGSDFTDNNSTVVTAVIVSSTENIRISEAHTIRIVSGKNVKQYSDLASDSNNVLLSKISGTQSFTLNSEKILYGNNFVIDYKGYDDTETGVEALLYLNGATLDNVKVVGNVYLSSKFNFQDPTEKEYGASLVKATNGSTVKNSYLANTRSPLKTAGTVTVSDSVIFGGNYANIDVTGTDSAGHLILTGNVTTINQITADTPNTVGLGIAIDLFADAATSVNASNCTLTQYNYLKQSDAAKLPNLYLNLTIDDVTVVTGTELNQIFNKKDDSGNRVYGDYIFKDSSDTEYINTGVVFVNGVQIEAKTNIFGEEYDVPASKLASLVGVNIVDGEGAKFTPGTNNYSGTVVTVKKGPKSLRLVGVTYTVTIYENLYFKCPTVTANNSGANFNNDASSYLPSNYVK